MNFRRVISKRYEW